MPLGGHYSFVLLHDPGLFPCCKRPSPATELGESQIGYSSPSPVHAQYCRTSYWYQPILLYNIVKLFVHKSSSIFPTVVVIRMACLAPGASVHLIAMRAPQRIGVIHGIVIARSCVKPNASLGSVALVVTNFGKTWLVKERRIFLFWQAFSMKSYTYHNNMPWCPR